MIIQTEFSLFSSAIQLTENNITKIEQDTVVLADNKMFGFPIFANACHAVGKKPVFGLQKEIDGNNYLFVATGVRGYRSMLKAERFDSFKELFDKEGVLAFLVEVKNIDTVIPVKYAIKSANEISNMIVGDYAETVFDTVIANSFDENDFYIESMIKAVGENSSYEEEVVKNHKWLTPRYDQNFYDLIKDIPDISKKIFGKPTPPAFKFVKEVAQEHGLPEDISEFELFAALCRKGLEKKGLANSPEYVERLEYEIGIIEKMNFPGYMLIVSNFVKYAKSKGIPVGPGRGSAGGSLVAYVLEITNIDPIENVLLFERFLNPERVSLPDIDMDFCRDRRSEVIEYVTQKYGEESVAQVITFGKIGGKSSVRDAARILREPLYLADKIAKSISDKPGITLEKEYEENKEEWDSKFNSDWKIKKIWDTALKLEGFTRNLGVHAAGLVISNEPLYKRAPMYEVNGTRVVGYDGRFLEDVNLVKFDFLGLKTLTVIDGAVKLAEANGSKIDINAIDYNDPKVYEMISTGETKGIFQIESPGMRDLIKRMKPDRFEDLVAILALYRPGPMDSGMLDSFVARKRGEEPVSYFFEDMKPVLEPILEPTYGVIVYQEQVMQIVQAIAGFSLGEADIIRRAMGKKKDMSAYTSQFVEGAVKQGYKAEEAEELFNLIAKFAGYGFNKSHSAAYSMVTFQTAWLKTYYPLEYMVSLINSEIDNFDKIAYYLEEAKRMGYEVVAPDIRVSKSMFTIRDGKIVFGLKAIKGVGNGSEPLQRAVATYGCDLKEVLNHTNRDIAKEIVQLEKLEARLVKRQESTYKKLDAERAKIAKLEADSKMTPAKEARLAKNKANAQDLERIASDTFRELNEVREKLEILRKEDTHSEGKINKRVFEALAMSGALDCFGYNRRTLVSFVNELLKCEFDIVSSDNLSEYEPYSLVQLEMELAGMSFSAEKILSEYAENAYIFSDYKPAKTKAGKEYGKITLVSKNGVIELNDFNGKSNKIPVGNIVEVELKQSGNYTNLVSMKKAQKLEKVRSGELKLQVFDPIPENVKDYERISVYEGSELIAIVKA